MVRAGVVKHPVDWKWVGYNEIQSPPHRYRIIDLNELVKLTNSRSLSSVKQFQNELGMSAIHRQVDGEGESFMVKEESESYNGVIEGKNSVLSDQNRVYIEH